MAVSPTSAVRAAHVFRVVARVLSVVLLVFAVALFIAYTRAGEGPFNIAGPRQNVADPWEPALSLVALAGLMIAWRWEVLGGVLAVGGMVVFEIVDLFAVSVTQPIIMFGPPGVSFLLAGLLTRYAGRSRGPSPPLAAGTPTSPGPSVGT